MSHRKRIPQNRVALLRMSIRCLSSPLRFSIIRFTKTAHLPATSPRKSCANAVVIWFVKALHFFCRADKPLLLAGESGQLETGNKISARNRTLFILAFNARYTGIIEVVLIFLIFYILLIFLMSCRYVLMHYFYAFIRLGAHGPCILRRRLFFFSIFCERH